MERQGPVSSTLEEFRRRHSCGSFYCQHPGCSHAANSSELRREHEESHLPRFVCMQAECGFFGWTFRTRSSLVNHNKQYHEEKVDQRVPSCLTESEGSSTELYTPLFTVRMPAYTTDQQKLTLVVSSRNLHCLMKMSSRTPICMKNLTSSSFLRTRPLKISTSTPQRLIRQSRKNHCNKILIGISLFALESHGLKVSNDGP